MSFYIKAVDFCTFGLLNKANKNYSPGKNGFKLSWDNLAGYFPFITSPIVGGERIARNVRYLRSNERDKSVAKALLQMGRGGVEFVGLGCLFFPLDLTGEAISRVGSLFKKEERPLMAFDRRTEKLEKDFERIKKEYVRLQEKILKLQDSPDYLNKGLLKEIQEKGFQFRKNWRNLTEQENSLNADLAEGLKAARGEHQQIYREKVEEFKQRAEDLTKKKKAFREEITGENLLVASADAKEGINKVKYAANLMAVILQEKFLRLEDFDKEVDDKIRDTYVVLV